MFSFTYFTGWVILYTWQQPIINFTKRVSQNLTWIDRFIEAFQLYDE
jgi:hypothetical protein